MKYLEPMRLRPDLFKPIEAEIKNIFDHYFYAPLMEVLKKHRFPLQLENERDPIVDAIREGRVYKDGDYFKGQFNASISKRFKQLGAKYSLFYKGWKFESLPPNISMAVANAEMRMADLIKDLVSTIDSIDVEVIVGKSKLDKEYLKSVEEINAQFERTTRSIAIKPKFTKEQAQAIANDYATNLELYIVDWSKKNILKLRQDVTQKVVAGKRAEGLAKLIEKNYRVSRDKAKFLARQETSLLMSKMREERYKGAGLNRYKWAGAMDERERPDHKALQGKIFTWDNPPITNRETGARNHPGEDFGCRCVAVPIVEGFNDK